MKRSIVIAFCLVFSALVTSVLARSDSNNERADIFDRVKHGFADSSGVKIHYAMLGPDSGSKSAPLIVMIHGFPDFWYS